MLFNGGSVKEPVRCAVIGIGIVQLIGGLIVRKVSH